MATHLDLEEQEQLDQIKHFWARYGNLITGVLVLVFGALAAYNGWNYWQNRQATQAASLFDEVQRAVEGSDAARLQRVLGDMKKDFSATAQADQAALLVAKRLHELAHAPAARETLAALLVSSKDPGVQALARLRLADLDLQAKAFDTALAHLAGEVPTGFEAVFADRRGDVLLAQGKADLARTEYQNAYKAFAERAEYRRLVEVKLAALGLDVASQKTEVRP